MNTKLHAICDSQGRPIDLFLTAGPVSDYIGARALISGLPKVKWLLGDRGYDADWFGEALQDKKIRHCIPGRKKRKTPVRYDKRRYKRRNRIEIMFGRLKGWRRVATAARRPSSLQSHSLQPSSSGYERERVLSLESAHSRRSATSRQLRHLEPLRQPHRL